VLLEHGSLDSGGDVITQDRVRVPATGLNVIPPESDLDWQAWPGRGSRPTSPSTCSRSDFVARARSVPRARARACIQRGEFAEAAPDLSSLSSVHCEKLTFVGHALQAVRPTVDEGDL
jgi:hypothetical protein